MISNLVKETVRTRMDQVGRVLARTGLTPDVASILGLAINGAVAVVLASGRFGLGGLLLLLAAPFDMVDGALARATGKGSAYGAFLDSMLDRYSEVDPLLRPPLAHPARPDPRDDADAADLCLRHRLAARLLCPRPRRGARLR